jgi:hypothetical protein
VIKERLVSLLDRKRLLWGGGLTAVILLLGWLLFSYGQAGIVAPISRWLWLMYHVLITTSQKNLWALILFVAAFNILLSLLAMSVRPPQQTVEEPVKGQTGAWLERLRLAGQSGFFGEELVGAVRNLLVRDMTIREHQTDDSAWQRIRRGQLPLSAAARELLGYGQSFEPSPELRGRRRGRTIITIMAEVAAYLESKSEVRDEQ